MKGKNKLVPRLLGITKESVMRVDEKTKDVVQEWPLTTVKRWAASPKSFTLVLCGVSAELQALACGYFTRPGVARTAWPLFAVSDTVCMRMSDLGTLASNVFTSQRFMGVGRGGAGKKGCAEYGCIVCTIFCFHYFKDSKIMQILKYTWFANIDLEPGKCITSPVFSRLL